jgi:two-component system NarL family sensor kinase
MFPGKVCAAMICLLLLVAGHRNATAQLTRTQMDSLQGVLGKAKEDSNKVKLLMTLGNNVGYSDDKKALAYGKEGYDLSRKINYPLGIGRTAYLLANTYMDLGDFAQSDSFLNVAEKHYLPLSDRSYLGTVYDARGSWNFMQAKYWAAAENYTRAAEVFDQIKDTSSSITTHQNLIAVLAQTRNFEKAVTLSLKVLPILEKRKDTLQMGYTLQGLVTDLIYLDRIREAKDHIGTLHDIADHTPDISLAAESYSTIGTFYFHEKDFRTAVSFFKQALQKGETLGSQYQIANHNKSIGSSYLQLNDLPHAEKYLRTAMDVARRYHNTRAIYNISITLSEYYAKTGDYHNAYKSLLQHLTLKDSILNVDTRNYATYLESKYDSEKKEAEILRLQKIQEQKDFDIRRRNIYMGIGAGLLVFMLLLLSLLRRNFRNKQKLARQQAALQEEKIGNMEKQQQLVSLQSMINGEETERTRLARDLHDGLGGLFSTVKMHFSSLQHEVPSLQGHELYRKTFELVDSASEELRKIAHNLMPEVLMKLGLVEALKDFCNHVNAGKLMKISLQSYGMEERLAASTEIMLYRIIQELVNNIIKHASATDVIIQLNREGHRLSLTVEDNGRGFDVKEAEGRRHMGIETVKSRVNYLNGKLSIDSRKDIGTTVMIDLLLNEG